MLVDKGHTHGQRRYYCRYQFIMSVSYT